MPHDINGTELHKGDIVSLRCEVRDIQPGATACNVTLQALDGAAGEYRPTVACNAGSVQLERRCPCQQDNRTLGERLKAEA